MNLKMLGNLRVMTATLAAAIGFLLSTFGVSGAQEPVRVFAAASLKNALDSVSSAWSAQSGLPTAISYAGSSALAKQIEAGAPADVFVSADRDWMDYLTERQLVDAASRFDLLGNRLVLIGPAGASPIEIFPGFDLKGLLGDGRLAMAAPDSVPAGRYGKAALETLGVWETVKGTVAGAENVRAALQYVSRGEAQLGVVYQTDAGADPGVVILATFPENSHPPIIYPAARVASSASPSAVAYLAFLKSPEARSLFEAAGFTVLGDGK